MKRVRVPLSYPTPDVVNTERSARRYRAVPSEPAGKAESMILNQPKHRYYDIIILGSGSAVIESELLEPHPIIQTLASVQLHGDLTGPKA